MKNITTLFIEIILIILLAEFPSFSQLSWKYTRIKGSSSLTKSSPASSSALTSLSTPSNYPNITLHSDNNVDQSEMTISSLKTNSVNVLSGANSVIQNVYPVSYNQGYYYSTSEGSAWAGSDTLPTNSITLSDPVTGYDINGNAFYAFLKSTDYGNAWTVVVKKSSNNGVTWMSDVSMPNAGDPDKDHMIIDNNSSSLYKNYIYVAWTDFSLNPSPIKLSRSRDGGTICFPPKTGQ